MDLNSAKIIGHARKCHTKHAWSVFASLYGEFIETTTDKKLLTEVFKNLASDKKASNFDYKIFLILLRGAQHINNLDLALQILTLCHKHKNLSLYLEAIEVHLSNSNPKEARKVVSKALKVQDIKTKDELKLRMMIVSTFAEEGKYKKAKSMFKPLEKLILSEDLSRDDKYSFTLQIARLHFFLGNYEEAIPYFKDSSEHYIYTENWEIAAKSLFNTAACLGNSDNSNIEEAFFYIEKCREVCEKNSFKVPLAHIESFYGLNSYQRGNFTEAKEYFYAALQHTQDEEAKFNKIHFLSMLALTYYASGKFHLGKKYAMHTLELAENDESDRYRTRYINLKVEMLWQEGKISESQKLIKPAINSLSSKGIHTLEELATFNIHLSQESLLNSKNISQFDIKISETLKKNCYNWLETTYGIAEIFLNIEEYKESEKRYRFIIETSIKKENRQHLSKGILGLIRLKLMQNELDKELKNLTTKFGVSVAKMAHTPLKAEVQIIQASISYKKGDLNDCLRSLKAGLKLSTNTWSTNFVLKIWINTLEGKSSKITTDKELDFLTRMTNIYFSPCLNTLEDGNFMIANKYVIDASKQPRVRDIIQYAISRGKSSFTIEDLQKDVWQQSTNHSGWEQKVRNSLQRVRKKFSPCIVPILLSRNGLRLYHEAIPSIRKRKTIRTKQELILRSTNTTPLSSAEIAFQTGFSVATVKRTLAELKKIGKLRELRDGRSIKYLSS